MSQAKQKKEHYLVKDLNYGYLCKICGVSGSEPSEVKSKMCFPLPEFGFPSASKRVLTPEERTEATVELQQLQEETARLEELLAIQELSELEVQLEQLQAQQLSQALEETAAQAKRLAEAAATNKATQVLSKVAEEDSIRPALNDSAKAPEISPSAAKI